MLTIVVEHKREDETRIQQTLENDNEKLLIHFPNRFRKQKVTSYTFTCPYCFEPFNTIVQAKACRDDCHARLEGDARFKHYHNRVVKITDGSSSVFGRVVSAPDSETILVTLDDGRCVQVLYDMVTFVQGL